MSWRQRPVREEVQPEEIEAATQAETEAGGSKPGLRRQPAEVSDVETRKKGGRGRKENVKRSPVSRCPRSRCRAPDIEALNGTRKRRTARKPSVSGRRSASSPRVNLKHRVDNSQQRQPAAPGASRGCQPKPMRGAGDAAEGVWRK